MAMKDVTVVMAHGGWADGSSWARVITRLAAHGLKSVAAPLPLTDLADEVGAQGDRGGVIGLAGRERVRALVYVTAFAPDEGETLPGLFFRAEPHPQAP